MRYSFRPPIHRPGDVRQPWFNRAGLVLGLGASSVTEAPKHLNSLWLVNSESVA